MAPGLHDFIQAYDLYDKGVHAIECGEAGRVRFIFELFHCDDPERNDEGKKYRLTAIFRPQDVFVHEGELWHEEGPWLGTVLDLQAAGSAVKLGIEWKRIGSTDTSWTSLSLLAGPLEVEEVVSDLRMGH